MALIGKTAEEQISNFLMEKIRNAYGVYGLMGNLSAESGLNPKNLENACERLLKAAGKTYCTDDTYTVAVDSDKISREEFLYPLPGRQFGYGIAQWTSAGRKAGLYDLVKAKGVSIGDLETQLKYLDKELNTSYKYVLNVLKIASSIREASDIVLTKFERPKDQSEANKIKRAEIGLAFFKKYVGENPHVSELEAAQKQPASSGEIITHTVKRGDTLYSLAKRYKTTVDKIVADNIGKYPTMTARYIVVGWKLTIIR